MEFVFLGTLLLVPLVYFVIAISQVQAASFAVVSAADQAAKVFVESEEEAAAEQSAEQAAVMAAADFGFGPERLQLTVFCSDRGCLDGGSSVTTEVAISVPLPLLAGTGLSIATVSSSATHVVERYG